MHRRLKSCCGLSLIEILMIIAIIGILASILFPVFFNTRSRGRKCQCVSNLKQLAHAFSLYISDWNSTYPSPGGRKGNFNYWAQSGNGGLVRYVRNNGGTSTVWCCPELSGWHGMYPARTYCMNSYLRYPPDIDYPSCIPLMEGLPEEALERREDTILLFEGAPLTAKWPNTAEYDYIYRCGNWTCVAGWCQNNQPKPYTLHSEKPWHEDKNNYLYCDGHVRSFRPNKYPNYPKLDETNEWWVRKTQKAAQMRNNQSGF